MKQVGFSCSEPVVDFQSGRAMGCINHHHIFPMKWIFDPCKCPVTCFQALCELLEIK